MRVVVYSRPSCHLCQEATTVLTENGISHEEIDVGGDSELEHEFGSLVPVVEVDGKIVFHAGMNPKDLPEIIEPH